MDVNESLAHLSNGLVYGAMVVYALSLICFAASFASGRAAAQEASEEVAGRRKVDVTKKAAVAGSEGKTATATLTRSDTPAVAPDEPEELPPGRRAGNIAFSLMWLAAALLLAGIVARGLSAGRPPWGNMYEFSLMAAFAISAIFLGISTRRDLRWLGVFVTGMVLLTLGAAVTVLYTESAQLVPALKSVWLVIHVLAAITCSGAFTVGAAVTALYLVRDRAEIKAKQNNTEVQGFIASRVPDADRLDMMAYRINAFVFPLWTFAVIAGAIWAENAWGRYWGWDPKETWAFITWVIYAAYLHARATVGWRGRKAAIICLLGFTAFLINYFGVNFFATGLHSYAGVSG